MANNSLQAQRGNNKPIPSDREASFTANGMQVKLTPDLVKKYLVSGDASAVTDQEIAMFINMCKYNGLNPWLKEAYCIKYGNSPATVVPGKDAFKKRADSDPNYDGEVAGIIVLTQEGQLVRREGCFVLDGEELVGGFAKVFRKDRSHPAVAEVSLAEYAARKKDGTVNGQWSSKPATMIRKVALVQALREAFPAKLGALYAAEEMGVTEPVTADYEIPAGASETVTAAKQTTTPNTRRTAASTTPRDDAPIVDDGGDLPFEVNDMSDDFFNGGEQ